MSGKTISWLHKKLMLLCLTEYEFVTCILGIKNKFVLSSNLCNSCLFLHIWNLISPFIQALAFIVVSLSFKTLMIVDLKVIKSSIELQRVARGKYENKHLRNMVEHVCNVIKSKMHSCPPLKLWQISSYFRREVGTEQRYYCNFSIYGISLNSENFIPETLKITFI